jgi:hypothetical protein
MEEARWRGLGDDLWRLFNAKRRCGRKSGSLVMRVTAAATRFPAPSTSSSSARGGKNDLLLKPLLLCSRNLVNRFD